jgi:ribosomal protein S18 acetylase RimI-like enzyme
MNPRAYQGEADQAAMAALAAANPDDNLHVVDLPYRFCSWAFDDPANVGVWVDGAGQLLAWAVMQTPFWSIDYVVSPDAGSGALTTILAWAHQRARECVGTAYGRPAWFPNVFSTQLDRQRELEAAGFASQADVGDNSWSKVLMLRPAAAPLGEAPLPPGFAIRSLAGASEVEAYTALHQAVFESKNMTAPWRARTLRHPGYRRDLDLVAVAPDGRLAAFCIGWLGPAGSQIEPMGVHADFRKLGLGRAILTENLRRLHAAGAARIYVETDSYRNAAFDLYEAAGFRVARDVLVYRKDYAPM